MLGLAWLLCSAACLRRTPMLEPGRGAQVLVRGAQLGHERVDVHLVQARVADDRPLLLYTTGDGGWRSADRGLFHHLALGGYPLAGISARHYLGHLRFEATTPTHVAEDYGHLIAFAKHELELPVDTPTVLVGFSRGASLAVVAAGQPALQRVLAGVLAIALTDEEQYVRTYRTRTGRDPRDLGARELATLGPYDVLDDVGLLPLAVIQSTRDGYVPAARARQLFGPDGERRRMYALPARSHTFAGARDALYAQARVALEWIAACGPITGSAPTRRKP